jgi:uncharacterized protein YbjT (DUF2867 family)
MAKYVIAGATGRVGSTVAGALLERGEAVTVIVRDEASSLDWTRRGAAVARGSLDDRRFVRHTVRDAAGLFTLLPENIRSEDFHAARRRMADAIAGATRDSGVPHVVMLSALAAVLPEGNGPAKDLHYCEQQLRASARHLTVLRSCYFQDNVATVLPVAIHTGIYPNFFGSADAPIPMIATEDLGRFAAQALLRPPAAQEIVDVFGPLYSIRQVAHALTVVLGRDVEVFNVPPERHRDTLTEAGLARPVADTVAELFAAFNAGLIQPRGDRRVTGTIGIMEVIRRYAEGSGIVAPAAS